MPRTHQLCKINCILYSGIPQSSSWNQCCQNPKETCVHANIYICMHTQTHTPTHAETWTTWVSLSTYLYKMISLPLAYFLQLEGGKLEQKFYNQLEGNSIGKRQRPYMIWNLSLILVLHSAYQTKVALLAPITARLEHWTSQWLELVVASGIPQKREKETNFTDFEEWTDLILVNNEDFHWPIDTSIETVIHFIETLCQALFMKKS